MSRHRWTPAAGVAAATLALLAPSAPAAAQPYENIRYGGSETSVYKDCGTKIHEELEWSGHSLVREVRESDGQAYYGHNNYWFSSVVTNLKTDKSIIFSGRGTFRETKATHVEGTVWEFEWLEAGQPLQITDLDGNVLAFERGVVKGSTVFDTLGDGQPGGEIVSEVEPVFHGKFETGDLGFCDFVKLYLT